jgi:hypothetical protein
MRKPDRPSGRTNRFLLIQQERNKEHPSFEGNPLAQPYRSCYWGRGWRRRAVFLFAAAVVALGSGCGLDHYEQQMEAEQKRLKYLDDENHNLEGSPLKQPEKKEDKEAVPANEFFFRPPKGISTSPDPKPIGVVYRYPSTNANTQDNIQELLVTVVKTKEGTDTFRQSVMQTLRSLGLREGPIKTRDVGGVLAGQTVHYEFYELLGAPNQPGGIVYFHRGESVPGEGVYQVALAFRATPSQPVIASDSPVMELSLATLRVGSGAQTQHSRYKPPPQTGARGRR